MKRAYGTCLCLGSCRCVRVVTIESKMYLGACCSARSTLDQTQTRTRTSEMFLKLDDCVTIGKQKQSVIRTHSVIVCK